MIFGIIGFMVLSVVSFTLYSQTADEILQKMIEAQGGRKALEAIKDNTVSGSIQMVSMNINGSMIMYQKEPDKMRMNFEIMGMTFAQAYDGNTAWMTNPQTGTAQEMPEKIAKYFKRQAMGNGAILNPQKHGIKYELKGKEKINETEYLVMEQIYPDDFRVTLYIDPATYLTYKTKSKTLNQMEAEVDTESILSDYKKVEGIMTPYSITVFQDGQEYIKMAITEISYNSNLEDSLFKMQ
jgi:nitrogen fixation/metabolism regulation signal transduction histidine kinase